MTLFKEIAERHLTRFINEELEAIHNYPSDVVQGTYLEIIEHIEDEELDISMVALGALFMQGLESEWQEQLSSATHAPLIDLDRAHEEHPRSYYELAPGNQHGVFSILCDLDTGAIIGPMTKEMSAQHTAWLMDRVNKND